MMKQPTSWKAILARRRRILKKGVLIGERLKAIEYYDVPKAEAEGLKQPNLAWRHEAERPDIELIGLSDGSVLLESLSGQKLWDYR